MSQEHAGKGLENRLKEIRHLLTHLHGEIEFLEESYASVLLAIEETSRSIQQFQNDDLTGLLRRKPFFTKLDLMLSNSRSEVTVLMLDIDHFKRINDTYGHPAGDAVIRAVADVLAELRETESSAIAGRFGGEEFVVAIEGSKRRGFEIAERIRSRIQSQTVTLPKGQACNCTVSVGVASTDGTSGDTAQLVEAADRALYEAKHSGRNQVRAA